MMPTAPIDELHRFVRSTLGCGCPDEVLADIKMVDDGGGVRGLDVGGRLMVRVVVEPAIDELISGFPEMVERYRSIRDQRGFNRLRLVIAHSWSDELKDVLAEMLAVLSWKDERTHIHVIEPNEIPNDLIGSG
jgi:hypothetical protein